MELTCTKNDRRRNTETSTDVGTSKKRKAEEKLNRRNLLRNQR